MDDELVHVGYAEEREDLFIIGGFNLSPSLQAFLATNTSKGIGKPLLLLLSPTAHSIKALDIDTFSFRGCVSGATILWSGNYAVMQHLN